MTILDTAMLMGAAYALTVVTTFYGFVKLWRAAK